MRKIVLDVDPGIDDALALSFALFDPNVEIVAATSVGGATSPANSARNLQRVVEFLDPPRLPLVGVGAAPNVGLPLDRRQLDGPDGLGGLALPVAERRAPRRAEKVICDAVRLYPHQTSILALGPLTNVARAFQRDPEIPRLLNRLIVAGGAYEAPGNVAPCAEFNIFCDPEAARYVFRTPCAKTLVPLDLAERFRFSLDDLDKIEANDASEIGAFVRRLLLITFRTRRRVEGRETIYLQELIAYFALVEPALFSSFEAAGDVEINGELTRGATIFDRRAPRVWRRNIEVVCEIDAEQVRQKILDGLNRVVRKKRPTPKRRKDPEHT